MKCKVKEMGKEKRQIELSERCNIDMFEILQQPEQKQHKSNSIPMIPPAIGRVTILSFK